MSDDLNIKIGADSSSVKTQTDSAKASIRSMSDSARSDAAAMAAGFAQLNATLLAMNASMKTTAESTKTLSSYADMAFYLGIAKAAFVGLDDAIKGQVASLAAAQATMNAVNEAPLRAAQGFGAWAESMAYSTAVGTNLRVMNTSLAGETVGAIGRMLISFSEWKNSLFGISDAADMVVRSQMAANGSLARLTETAKGAGFADSTAAISSFVTELQKVPGVSEQVALSIEASMTRVPAYSAQMNDVMVLLVKNMSTSAAEAQNWTTQLVAALSDPLVNGKQMLDTLGGVNREYYAALTTAQNTSDVNKAQRVILAAMTDHIRMAASAERSKLLDMQKEAENASVLGIHYGAIASALQQAVDGWRNIVGSSAAHSGHVIETEKSVSKMVEEEQTISAEMEKQTLSLTQQRKAVQDVLGSTTTLAERQAKNSHEIETLREGLRGATTDAAELVKQFEGFKATPYMDKSPGHPEKDHEAVGYGQHSILGQEVTKDSTFTQEEIYKDFANRIAQLQIVLAEQIGASWDKLSDRAKASITSVAYNFGHLPSSVADAAKTGGDQAVAQSILGLKGLNEGVNDKRRDREASNITNGPTGLMNDDEKAKAADVLPEKIDEQIKLNDEKKGGSAIDREAFLQAQEALSVSKDDVRTAEEKLSAANKDLKAAEAAGATDDMIRRRRLIASQAEIDLDNKKFERAKALADLEIKGADKGSKEELQAKDAKADLTLNRKTPDGQSNMYEKDSVEYKAALQEKKDAQDAYDAAKHAKDAEAETVSFTNAMNGLNTRKQILEEEAQTGVITKEKMYAGEMVIENERTELERAHWTKLKGIWDEGDKQYKQASDKLAEIDSAAEIKRESITRQSNAAIFADYQRIAQSITNTMSTSIMGMIQGTSNFRDMMRAITLDIIKMFLDAGLKMVATWAAQQMQKTVMAVTGEQTITAATVTGVAQRSAANAAGATTDVATKAMSVIKSIMSSAAETFAGIFGFLSPVMGPAAAGPAAASMGAVQSVASAVAYDVGAWEIPTDQMAVVHKGETIMTASQGAAFRSAMNMISNGSAGQQQAAKGGDNHAHFHVSSPDAAGVKAFFGNNSRELVKALGSAMKDGNHVGMRRLAGM